MDCIYHNPLRLRHPSQLLFVHTFVCRAGGGGWLRVTTAMSVQVVSTKMAEADLQASSSKELKAVPPGIPKSEEKKVLKNKPKAAAATSPVGPSTEVIAKGESGDPSHSPTPSPDLPKMQASAMRRTDARQNGESLLNSDGTVAEAPKTKKVMPLKRRQPAPVINVMLLAPCTSGYYVTGAQKIHYNPHYNSVYICTLRIFFPRLLRAIWRVNTDNPVQQMAINMWCNKLLL